ncbi:MAG: hypothetical protein H6508_02085 [Calditrichaeota bacterium]|nr:hypothetical protein [Calditrichota bacterium]
MKVSPTYTPVQQMANAPKPPASSAPDRSDAEDRLRELIAQKRTELEGFRPFEELGKHLDLRA